MCSQKDIVKDAILKSLQVIRLYDWLLDLYVLDFFVDDHWAKLPSSWQECFENMSPRDLGNILSGIHTNHVLPLSFLSLVKSVEALSLPRMNKHDTSEINMDNITDSCGGHPRLKNLFLKHVKLKKRHEISLMADVVHTVAVESNCEAVIDFGSGLGHLVRVLAYKNNLYVAGIECQSQLTEEARYQHMSKVGTDVIWQYKYGTMQCYTLSNESAILCGAKVQSVKHITTECPMTRYAGHMEDLIVLSNKARKWLMSLKLDLKLDLQLEYTASKHLSAESKAKLHRPIHLSMTLTSNQQLVELNLPETMKSYGLIGLHPCGDLGPLLLKHFVNCEQVKYICVVGCCYMKLSCDGNETGYPLSDYVKGLDSELSYVSREIACHSIDVYLERLRKNNYDNLKVHAFRAALERILVEHDPKLKHAPVRSIKHSDAMTFQQYCSLALERLMIPVCVSDSSDVRQWRRVVIMYTLRLSLAPLVECVILLDRVLFALEHGFACEIRPVFDPKISPRNHIIIARKTK